MSVPGLSADKIDRLLRKWLRFLPHPFTAADQIAGCRYDNVYLQAEFSPTEVPDRPVHGRLFFEQVIREEVLHLGLPTRSATYSADEPERLRGPQHDAAWCDEPAFWRYPEAWDMLMFGLRLGPEP